MSSKMGARLASEFLGTFWLVFGGCGSAIFAAKFLLDDSGQTQLGIGFLGVALAFGLTVVTMAYAVGHVSGAHFNPAITIGAAVGGRFAWKDVPAYIVAQVLGGLLSGGVLAFIYTQSGGYETLTGNMAANGFDLNSPGGYTLAGALVAEIVLTMFFVWVVLGATDGRAPKGFAPLAIGLALTLIHLISIPITNTSVNPARSTAVAFFNGDGAPGQLWLFWVAPIIGAIIAGITYAFVSGSDKEPIEGDVAA